jgi:hypothetical protein
LTVDVRRLAVRAAYIKIRRGLVKGCEDGVRRSAYRSRRNSTPEDTMPAIKLHLEQAEYDAVERFATLVNVKPEAVLYAALNRLMLTARDPDVRADIIETWSGHHQNLPLWSDSARSVHAYEGKADDEPEPSKYM